MKKEKFKKLKEYLKKNLVKGFVRKSILSIKYAVFFILKKTVIINCMSIIAK